MCDAHLNNLFIIAIESFRLHLDETLNIFTNMKNSSYSLILSNDLYYTLLLFDI
jgi:hypothetical protein